MGGSSTTTTSGTNTPTGWMAGAGNSLNNAGQSILNTPYNAYSGQGVAPLSQSQNYAGQLAQNNAGQQYIGSASNAYSNANTNWNQATANQYMSPYAMSALNPVAQQMANQFGQQNRATADASTANGAFGGTRQALLQDYNQGQQSQAIGNMYATGMENAYQNAEGQYNADRSNQMALGQQYGMLGANAANLNNQQIQNLMYTGGAAQQTQQAQDQWAYQQYLYGQQYPYQQASEYKNLITGIPYSGSWTQTQPGGSQAAGALGGAASIVGMGSQIYGMFSDPRLKTDIERVGRLDNGLNVYKYRYKGSPVHQIGVMADEVAEKDPRAVALDRSGYLKVDYRRATSPEFGAWKEAA